MAHLHSERQTWGLVGVVRLVSGIECMDKDESDILVLGRWQETMDDYGGTNERRREQRNPHI